MKYMNYVKFFILASIFSFLIIWSNGCGGINQLGINLFSLKIQVFGQSNSPLTGAVVSSNNGEAVTVDSTGIATLHFSGVGAYNITVKYENNIVASYNVSMPTDAGKTLTANYVAASTPPATTTPSGGGNENVAPGGGSNYFAMMGTRFYPLLFQYVFNAYGYSIDLGKYGEGQYTDWQISTNGENQFTTRKAYLKKLPNSQEWWQVSFRAKEDSMLMEVLFSDKMESIRRMRAKFGNDVPKEIPVTEGWYNSPMQLTPESIEGSVVKKGVSVTVPAGTFTCDQLEFGVAQGITLRLWRSTNVPGGVVKYEMSGGDGKAMYSAELKSYGDGASTDLGSY